MGEIVFASLAGEINPEYTYNNFYPYLTYRHRLFEQDLSIYEYCGVLGQAMRVAESHLESIAL